jgi:chromosome segregation ATPase
MSFSLLSTGLPADLNTLMKKTSQKEERIKQLEKQLLETKQDLKDQTIQFTTRIQKLESIDKLKSEKIQELEQTIEFLEIDNNQYSFTIGHLESQLSARQIELIVLKSEFSTLKSTLKSTIERNNYYVEKINEMEENYLNQYAKMNSCINEYKKKLKLSLKPKIN